MAMKRAAAATNVAAAASRGLRSLFSTNIHLPSQPTNQSHRFHPEPSPNLYISGLGLLTTNERLRECFAKFGKVTHARVDKDCFSGYSKGYGFVKYPTIEEAAAARAAMDGKFLDGRVIVVEYDRPRRSRRRAKKALVSFRP